MNDEKKLLAPVLDRLLNHSGQMVHQEYYQIMRQLRESVRRDLEYLLNTRIRCLSPPEGTHYLKQSNANFGLPDLASFNLSSLEKRREFCRIIEKNISAYEPRVRTVKVTCDKAISHEDPSIHFRVEAVLHCTPASERIIFDSVLNPVKLSVDISEIDS